MDSSGDPITSIRDPIGDPIGDPIFNTIAPNVDPIGDPIGDPIWDPIIFCRQLRTKSLVRECGVGWGGRFGSVTADVNWDVFRTIWVPVGSLHKEIGSLFGPPIGSLHGGVWPLPGDGQRGLTANKCQS